MILYEAPQHIPAPDLSTFFGPNGLGFEALSKAEDQYRIKVAEYAKAFGAHALAGKFVKTPYADGFAEYCIAKVDGKVSLIHVPLMDEWRDARFERTATVKELTRMVASAEAREKFFS